MAKVTYTVQEYIDAIKDAIDATPRRATAAKLVAALDDISSYLLVRRRELDAPARKRREIALERENRRMNRR